ncbi:hypothetical protein [Sandaracinus amylolyticus]|uniref:hypothetical protein n=1 Tax=Sandaracinus amylolyticus TaxID=927083 RepID=UPI001F1E4C1C|nr:hypothetical protein [Sandaracinus amylolyticus]UJR84795.1 Hypothetical protein I5071_68740 [Sandaracinus amylolyticus]
MRRVWIVGSSGAGKTTLARTVASRLELPHVELDAIHHQADWRPLATPEFRAQVEARLDASDRWVICGQYVSKLGDLVQRRADTIVWLDLPRALVMRRLIARSLRRVITREELWNGNRESWRGLTSADPEENVVLWSWTRFAGVRARYAALFDEAPPHLTLHRLRSPAEVARFVHDLRL